MGQIDETGRNKLHLESLAFEIILLDGHVRVSKDERDTTPVALSFGSPKHNCSHVLYAAPPRNDALVARHHAGKVLVAWICFQSFPVGLSSRPMCLGPRIHTRAVLGSVVAPWTVSLFVSLTVIVVAIVHTPQKQQRSRVCVLADAHLDV